MIDSVHKRLFALLRQIYVPADVGVFKAQLTRFAIGDCLTGLTDKVNIRFDLRLADGAGFVRLVDGENTDGEAALRAGVDVDKFKILIVEVVCRLTSDKEHTQERAGLVAEHTDVGGSEERNGYALREEEFCKRRWILDSRVGNYEVFAAIDVQRRENYDNRSHKVHRSEGSKAVILIEWALAVQSYGVDGALKVAELVQHSLGVSGGSGGVYRVGGRVVIALFKAGERRGVHDLLPVLCAQLSLAAAVGADIVYALRSVGVLDKRPRGAGLPDSYHRNNGQNAARQVNEHEVLFSDTALLEIRIDPAAHIVELRIGYAL